MSSSSAGPTSPPPGPWEIALASARGKAHEVRDLDNQDAGRWCADARAIVLAIADGHGHERHFRSGRGADLAVGAACEVALPLGARIADEGDQPAVEALGRYELIPALLASWAAAVEADTASHPFGPAEDGLAGHYGDPPVMAYGSTLLVALVAGRWALLAQIGDGDIMTVDPTGTTRSPLPVDPVLDGVRTTSLCQPDAEAAFRLAVVDLLATPMTVLLLASDGYGNAQVDDIWQPAVGADLLALLRAHGAGWIRRNLPDWVARCASAEGAADDTTVALLLAAAPHGPCLLYTSDAADE